VKDFVEQVGKIEVNLAPLLVIIGAAITASDGDTGLLESMIEMLGVD
jgi:hypothetical protein